MSLKKRIAAIGLAVLMMFILVMPAAAEPTSQTVTVSKAEEMDGAYYTKLKDENNTALTGNPSLTIVKYQYEGTGYGQNSKPIRGVDFTYTKVGGLYQLTLSDGTTVTAYGVKNDFATAVGLTDPDYTLGEYQYFKDGEAIQAATGKATKEGIQNFLTSVQVVTGTTNDEGTIECTLNTTNPWGLYLVVESNVSNAQIKDEENKWQPISIVESQAPFLVALPTMVTEDGKQYWENDVVANVKNAVDTAEVEKKIVVGNDETQNDGNETVADTDITTIGDTVHFRLKGTVLDITETSSKKIESYVLTDVISKGLTPVLNDDAVKSVVIDSVRVTGADPKETITLGSGDYVVSGLSDYTGAQEKDAKLDADFTGGQYFTITFTDSGLGKLTQLAKDPAPASSTEEKAVWFYYSATVNSNAVIGPKGEKAVSNNSGNPNKVKLNYSVTGSQNLVTGWDKVTEFTFGIDVTKQFEGAMPSDFSAVTFKLYSINGEGITKQYYSFSAAENGVYHTPTLAANENAATQLKLGNDKKISLKGLDEGTYYLEETATVPGYNLLKEPVRVQITADQGENTYVADAKNLATEGEYQGTFTQNGNKIGKVEFTVINTQGFQLPSTGGAGIWMFVIGGVIIIAAGGAYFLLTRKKKQ